MARPRNVGATGRFSSVLISFPCQLGIRQCGYARRMETITKDTARSRWSSNLRATVRGECMYESRSANFFGRIAGISTTPPKVDLGKRWERESVPLRPFVIYRVTRRAFDETSRPMFVYTSRVRILVLELLLALRSNWCDLKRRVAKRGDRGKLSGVRCFYK